MLQKEIYNNLFNKKANMNLIMESQEILQYDYTIKKYVNHSKKPEELIPMQITINKDSNDEYIVNIKLNGKIHKRKIVYDSSWGRKFTKTQIKTNDIDGIINDIKTDRFSPIINGIIKTLGFQDNYNDENNIINYTVIRN